MGADEFAAPLLDHRDLQLRDADRITYRLEQSFRYTYDTPVTSLAQRLVFVPRPRHGELHRRAHRVEVIGASVRRRTRQDRAGNTVLHVRAAHIEHSVEMRVIAVLESVRGTGQPIPAAALHDPRLRRPTRLTAVDARIAAMSADLARPGGGTLDVAERICAAVERALAYEYGVTGVSTTAAQALAGGKGVCQDAAHIMLALCRSAGLPARYVSGHLLGQGGTHAWVEVIVASGDGATAVAFDPCHGRRTDASYVTVAVGRDYADVAPTSGTYVGPPGGRLTTSRRVGVVAVA